MNTTEHSGDKSQLVGSDVCTQSLHMSVAAITSSAFMFYKPNADIIHIRSIFYTDYIRGVIYMYSPCACWTDSDNTLTACLPCLE